MALLIVAGSGPAAAQSSAGIVDEAKLGVLAHDVGIFGDNIEGGADIVGEVLFTSPEFFRIIGSPRPTLGASVNTAGKTDYAYFDFTWTATLWQPVLESKGGLYIGGFLGGAVHDGRLNSTVDGDKALGTRALYHLGAELGYQVTPVISVEAYFAHLSNAGAASHNGGLNNIGLRTGLNF